MPTSLLDTEVPSRGGPSPSEEQLASTKIYPLIHTIKQDVIENIDTALTWEQLTASDINFSTIRPLVIKYGRLRNLALIYACLIVRSHFRRMAEDDLAHASLNHSRSQTCELLAIRCLRLSAANYFELVAALTHSWNPLAGAPYESVCLIKKSLAIRRSEDVDILSSALEMAVSTDSKRFISAPLTQAVVNDIYSGRIIFTTISKNSLVADNYKQRQIEIYNCRKAPILDHYRLRVPRYNHLLQVVNITILIALFLLCLTHKDLYIVTVYEKVFILFGAAFALAEYTASREHGWNIYIANIWNVFDTAFIFIGCIYLIFRIRGLLRNDAWSSNLAFDVLACGACLLFPRLAFFAISNNVVVLALRGMIVGPNIFLSKRDWSLMRAQTDFVFFMTIASVCFSGLLFTLWELAQLTPRNTWTIKSIAWLLLQIWFGNTSLTFQQAESFHPFFGPIIMITFAALSNTLLITILISILTNTFARIDANAIEEHLFQFAISTIEGVKSEALFSYQPPFNLLAYAILAPLSWFVSPRKLHTANVFLIRVTSFPVLLIIAVYERHVAPASGSTLRRRSTRVAKYLAHRLPRKSATLIEAIVATPPPDESSLTEEEVPESDIFRNSRNLEFSETDTRGAQPKAAATPQRDRHKRINSDFGQALSSFQETGESVSSPATTPSRRSLNLKPPTSIGAGVTTETQLEPPLTPLAKLYPRRPVSVIERSRAVPGEAIEDLASKVTKLEHTLYQLNTHPIGNLTEEIKELHQRQARIESLLLTLTRGMRGEPGTAASRSGTL